MRVTIKSLIQKALFLLLISLAGASYAQVPQNERDALVALYNSTDGANWTDNTGWLGAVGTECSWFGITCANGSITRLYLTNNNLAGSLPSLSAFKNIEFLNFDSNNQLTELLPNLSGLTKLSGADFYGAQFSGNIPNFSNLPNLSYLNLGNNILEGNVPGSLIGLPSLNTLIINLNSSLKAAISDDMISTSLSAFSFDAGSVCTVTKNGSNWLNSLPGSVRNFTPCFDVLAQVDGDLLNKGDQLILSARLQDNGLEKSMGPLNIYLSLELPDQQTEVFFVLRDGKIEFEIGSIVPDSWIPTIEDLKVVPKLDTGLVTIFMHSMAGTEPEGEYIWKVRATDPKTNEVLLEAKDRFYFSSQDISVTADNEGLINSPVTFKAIVSNELSDNEYRWEFDDGREALGKTVSNTYDAVDRYRVTLIVTNRKHSTSIKKYHYVNIGRPINQTVYPLLGGSITPSKIETKEFLSLDCDLNWNVYLGKYNSLYIEAREETNVDENHIINFLSLADYFFEAYAEIFGWEFLPSTPSLNNYICGAVSGAGTGTAGSFYGLSNFTRPAQNIIKAKNYGAVIHESIHLWDFRGGSWINSEDSAHALTSGMEPIISSLLGTGQGMTDWGGDWTLLEPLSPTFIFSHYFRVNLKRYLSEKKLSWGSYYTAPFFNVAYEDEDIPENKEKMLVQGGLLMSLFKMHGASGLKSIFLAMEKMALNNSNWIINGSNRQVMYADLSQEQRAENFMRAVADGLQLDVSDYFSYWKWPLGKIDSYMSRYPLSDKILDGDDDGYSPLQGDFDDADPTVFPDAPEILDNKDNNLDGLIDENVYRESFSDISTVGITLPAGIYGTIDSLQDEDFFEFTLQEPAVVTFTVYSVRSDYLVPYSSSGVRNISTFAGSVYVDGRKFTDIVHEAMSAPESMGALSLTAGVHNIRVTSATSGGRNPNPGEYEIQAFVNEYKVSTTADKYINGLYAK